MTRLRFFLVATTRATVMTGGLNQVRVSGVVCASTPVDTNNDLDLPPSLPETIRALQQISGAGLFPAATPRATVKTGGLNQERVSGVVCASTPGFLTPESPTSIALKKFYGEGESNPYLSQVWWYGEGRLRPQKPYAPSPISGLFDSDLTPGLGGGGGESAVDAARNYKGDTSVSKLCLWQASAEECVAGTHLLQLTQQRPPCSTPVTEQLAPSSVPAGCY
ncbi:unnamed protein product [Schistocephalus solidus]|uniref:Uncharacterized protein n=1 Tax=Schistocephalus solidus TaxID=70667 RepID=A0A183SSC1_SCHSO|nr:unnamed protein product [Schistocephalus solidus]